MKTRITGKIEVAEFVIDTWYDRYTRSYVTQIKDAATGYEAYDLPRYVVSQYSGTREDAVAAIEHARYVIENR